MAQPLGASQFPARARLPLTPKPAHDETGGVIRVSRSVPPLPTLGRQREETQGWGERVAMASALKLKSMQWQMQKKVRLHALAGRLETCAGGELTPLFHDPF